MEMPLPCSSGAFQFPLLGSNAFLKMGLIRILRGLSIPLIGFKWDEIEDRLTSYATFNSPYWVRYVRVEGIHWNVWAFNSPYWVPGLTAVLSLTNIPFCPFNSPYWVRLGIRPSISSCPYNLSIPLIGFISTSVGLPPSRVTFNSPYWVQGTGIKTRKAGAIQLSIPLIGFQWIGKDGGMIQDDNFQFPLLGSNDTIFQYLLRIEKL